MTQVDFYILSSESDDARLTFACRLAEKAMHKAHKVYIHSASPGEGERLDKLLWTFSQGSFVPHRVVEADASSLPEPVLIGFGGDPAGAPRDLMINLAGEVPEFFSSFGRVAELVDEAPERKAQGRERYRYYRDRGYPLNTHRIQGTT